jgi:hypothetical protein
MNPICFYNKLDLDGVCSAAVIKHFVPECELVGVVSGELFPWDKVQARRGGPEDAGLPHDPELNDPGFKRKVYLVDISLPPKDMKKLALVSDLIWFDHNAAAIEANKYVVFLPQVTSPDYGVCELCWMYFVPHPKLLNFADSDSYRIFMWPRIPEAVQLLGRYAVLDEKNPDWLTKILPFQYGLRIEHNIFDPTSPLWESLFAVIAPDPDGTTWLNDLDARVARPVISLSSFIDKGNTILANQADMFKRIAENSFDVVLIELAPGKWGATAEPGYFMARRNAAPGGTDPMWKKITNIPHLRCLCLNTSIFSRRVFASAYNPDQHDVLICFFRALLQRGTNDQKFAWIGSVYSNKPEIDCAAIAGSFGRLSKHGHDFMCDTLPWEVTGPKTHIPTLSADLLEAFAEDLAVRGRCSAEAVRKLAQNIREGVEAVPDIFTDRKAT